MFSVLYLRTGEVGNVKPYNCVAFGGDLVFGRLAKMNPRLSSARGNKSSSDRKFIKRRPLTGLNRVKEFFMAAVRNKIKKELGFEMRCAELKSLILEALAILRENKRKIQDGDAIVAKKENIKLRKTKLAMVLPEFSFCVFSSLVLSKVNSLLGIFWQNINSFTNSNVESLADWMLSLFSFCLFEDMLAWLESKARLLEIVLLGLILVLLVAYLNDWFGVAKCFQSCEKPVPTFQFGYRKNNGPSIWKEHYTDALGQRQSPINILVNEALTCHCGPLEWNRYSDVPECMMMFNDGYSIMMNGNWCSGRPLLTGSPLENEVYVFNRLYFHWGPTDTEGSEHTIDYERFPLELHMIFLKEDYNDLIDAHNDNCLKGIVIVVFLFEITPVDNPGFLNSVTDNLHKVRNPKTGCCVEPFALSDIYPEFEFNYYKYDGSITQPPCSEIATYIIQTETIAVSKRQMSRFRKLLAFDGKPMVNNSRPVQKLNHRTVFHFIR